MRVPKPSLAVTNSATSAPINANVSEVFKPAKMLGSAAGQARRSLPVTRATPDSIETVPEVPAESDGWDDLVPAAPRRSRRRAWRAVLPPLVTFGCVVGLWYLVSYVLLSPGRRFLLPPPQQVIQGGFLTWSQFSQILDGLDLTARAAATSLR